MQPCHMTDVLPQTLTPSRATPDACIHDWRRRRGCTGSLLGVGLSPFAGLGVGPELHGVVLLGPELGNRDERQVLQLAVQGQLLQVCCEAGRKNPVRLLQLPPQLPNVAGCPAGVHHHDLPKVDTSDSSCETGPCLIETGRPSRIAHDKVQTSLR